MTTKSQINVLIYDYLIRNYDDAKDILPALKKIMNLPNESKPIGKLEDIVSEQGMTLSSSLPVTNVKNSKESIKKRRCEEDIKEHSSKRLKNDIGLKTNKSQDGRLVMNSINIISRDSDKTDRIERSLQKADFEVPPDPTLKEQPSFCSMNISTPENSVSKESHENSDDLFASDTNLLSDIDDIILDVRSLNKASVNANDELVNTKVQLPLMIKNTSQGGDQSPNSSDIEHPVIENEMTSRVKGNITSNINTTDGKKALHGKVNYSEANVISVSSSARKSSSTIEHDSDSSTLLSDFESEVPNSREQNKSIGFQGQKDFLVHISQSGRDLDHHPKDFSRQDASNKNEYLSSVLSLSKSSKVSKILTYKDSNQTKDDEASANNKQEFTIVGEIPSKVVNLNNENFISIPENKSKTQKIQKSILTSSDSNSSLGDDESPALKITPESDQNHIASIAFVTKQPLKELEMPKNDTHSDKESSTSTPRIIRIQEFGDSDSSVPFSDHGKKIVSETDALSTGESCHKNANNSGSRLIKPIGRNEMASASLENKSSKEKDISLKYNKDIGKAITNVQQSRGSVRYESDSSDDEIPASITTKALNSKSDSKCFAENIKCEQVTISTKSKTPDSSVKIKKITSKDVKSTKCLKASSESDSSLPSTDDEDENESNQKGSNKNVKSNITSKNINNPVKQVTKMNVVNSKTVSKDLRKIQPNKKTQPSEKIGPMCSDSDSSMPSSDDEEDIIVKKSSAPKSGPKIETETAKGASMSTEKSSVSEVNTNTKLNKMLANKESHKNVKLTPETRLPQRHVYESDSSMPSSSDEDKNNAIEMMKSDSFSNQIIKNGSGTKVKDGKSGIAVRKNCTKVINATKPAIGAQKSLPKPLHDSDSSLPSSDEEDDVNRTSKLLKPTSKSEIAKTSAAKKCNEKMNPIPKTKQPLTSSSDSDSSIPSSSDDDIKPVVPCKLIQDKKGTKDKKPTNSNTSTISSGIEKTNTKSSKAGSFKTAAKCKTLQSKPKQSKKKLSSKKSSKAGSFKTAAKCKTLQSKKKLSSKHSNKDSDSSLPSSVDDSAIDDNEVAIKTTQFVTMKSSSNNVSLVPLNVETALSAMKPKSASKMDSLASGMSSFDIDHDVSRAKGYPANIPKSKEFITSDSSDDDDDVDRMNPLSQINDASTKNVAFSKLSSQVVLTKLPALSLKSSPKLLITRDDDLSSLKSSDEEDDIQIISAAVARSAQKAKNVKAKTCSKANVKPIQLFTKFAANDMDSSLDSSCSEYEKEKVLVKEENIREAANSSINEGQNKTHSAMLTAEISRVVAHSEPMFTPSPPKDSKTLSRTKASPSREKDETYDSEEATDASSFCGKVVRALDLLQSDDEIGKVDQSRENQDIEPQASKTLEHITKVSKKVKSNLSKDITDDNKKSKCIKSGDKLTVTSRLSAEYEKVNSNSSSSVEQHKIKKQIQMSKNRDSLEESSVNKLADLKHAKDNSVDPVKAKSTLSKTSKHSGSDQIEQSKKPKKIETDVEKLRTMDDECDDDNDIGSKKKKKRKHRERESSPLKTSSSANNMKSHIPDEPTLKKKKSETLVSLPKTKSKQKNINIQSEIGDSRNINQEPCVCPTSSKLSSNEEMKGSKKLNNVKSSKNVSKAETPCSKVSHGEGVVNERSSKPGTEQSVDRKTSPLKDHKTSSPASRKRKRSSSSDLKTTFDATEKQDLVKDISSKDLQKKKKEEEEEEEEENESSNSDDDSQEEAPVQITFKKMNLLDSISKVLSPRRGQIASTPISKAVRLKTPNASIIRPLMTKVSAFSAGGTTKTASNEIVTNMLSSKRHQSSSESSSDSEMELSKSLFK